MKTVATVLLAASFAFATPAMAEQPKAGTGVDAPWPVAWFEIFRLAPGRHESFMRDIARADEVLAAGGQPPLKLYVHDHGGDWDVLIFKPVEGPEPTAAQEAAMAAKSKELGIETGPAYFVRIRENIAEHSDTKALGPISAAQWVARLEKWRAENAKAKK